MATTATDLSKRRNALIQHLRDQLALGRTLEEAKFRYLDLFDETEINEVIEYFKASDERFKSEKQISTLHDEPNYAGWYVGPDDRETSIWSGLKRQLKNKSWSDLMIENLDLASTGVVEQLAPPMSEKELKIKGLVLGYVQSGKTANYSAVIAKAVDAGYKLIIVLSGMHNNLREQTQARLKMEIVDPNPASCTTLTTVNENGDFQKRQNVIARRALSIAGFTLVVIKKNSSVLRNFHSWLDDASDEVIQKTPTLIIDDESDQASINTSKPEDDPTAINGHIRKLMTRFHVCTYVGYTATPFANVLVDARIESDVFPKDFLISLGKPPNYFGAEELFGRENVGPLERKDGVPVIRIIPPEEGAYFTSKTPDKSSGKRPKALMIPSIQRAVECFILACAARTVRGQHKKHMTMLLHISHLTEIQIQLKVEVDAYLTTLKFAAQNNDTKLKEQLMELWNEDFAVISKDFEGAAPIAFDEIWKYSKGSIEEVDTILENSKSLERLSFEGTNPIKTIVIGGNTLSRGLTLEGLTVSYFVRTSKSYDTLLQMGRWFGYRPGYIDLTRIFVTEELRDHFFHLATVEQEIRDEIKMMAANEEKPIHVGLRIRNHPHMKATAANKMRESQDCALTYSGTKIQARHLITRDEKIVTSNYSAIKELFRRCAKLGQKTTSVFLDYKNANLFRNVAPETILQFLDEFQFSSENGKFNKSLLKEYINKQANVNEVTDWSVAFLSSQSGKSVDLGGASVSVFDRSILRKTYLDTDSPTVQLRALSTPGDELIDLGDRFEQAVTRVEALLPEGRERESEIALRQRYRPCERGLVLIHPLNWQQTFADNKKFSLSEALTSSGPVFGVSFVFPFSKHDQTKYGFISNKTVMGPRLVKLPGIETPKSPVPSNELPSENSTKQRALGIDRSRLTDLVRAISWPLHFLDYETVQNAFQLFSVVASEENVPVHFILKIQMEPNGPLEHYDFLHTEGTDPRMKFLESLLEHIDGDRGAIVINRTDFPQAIAGPLSRAFPQFAQAFEEMSSRIIDIGVVSSGKASDDSYIRNFREAYNELIHSSNADQKKLLIAELKAISSAKILAVEKLLEQIRRLADDNATEA